MRSAIGTASAIVTSSKEEVAPGGCASWVASTNRSSFWAGLVELSGPAAPFAWLAAWTHVGFPSTGTKDQTTSSSVKEAVGGTKGTRVPFWHMKQEVALSGHPDVQELHIWV